MRLRSPQRVSPPHAHAPSARRIPSPRHMATLNKIPPKWSPSELISLETFRRLPKAELHRHLDGCLRVSTVIELAKEQVCAFRARDLPNTHQRITLPTFDEKELHRLVAVDKHKGVASLEEYLRGFDIVLPVLQKPYAITRAMYEACEDAALDGVRYLEVRFSPILHVNEGASLSSVMEAVCEGANMAESHFPIVVRIIVIGMRQLPPAVTTHLAEIAWRYREKGVAGFDIAGPEFGFSSKNFKEAFSLVRQQNVNCTLHAGEAAGPESIRDAIRYCGAHRIGHGVTLQQDPALLQYVADHGIAIECCPTSNCHTKAIRTCEDHPIRRYFDAGIVVVPCCDNCTVSDVTLSGEYRLVQEKFQFTTSEVARIIDYGFRASFMENGRKQRMRADVARTCVEVFRAEGRDVSGIVNDPYWLRMGIDLRDVGNPNIPYWGNHRNPSITAELLRTLPKADLHCRLDGSVSLPTVWRAFQEAKLSLHSFGYAGENTYENFCKVIKRKFERPEELKQAKKLLNSVLQTPQQIRLAVQDVLATAVADGVKYLELQVRPTAHLEKGLSIREVLRTVMEAKREFEAATPTLKVGVVLFSNDEDDPLAAYNVAQVAVEERASGVVGYGLYCTNLSAEHLSFYRATCDHMKANNMDLIIFAKDPQVVVAALEAGAARINGAFDAHMNTGLMNHLANHNVPVEVGLTSEYEVWTRDLRTFVHPVRLFLDKGVPLTLCSFRGAFGPSRIEALETLVTDCKLSIAELLKLLSHGFAFNLQTLRTREAMLDKAWADWEAVLKPQGFEYLLKKFWFPTEIEHTLLIDKPLPTQPPQKPEDKV